MREKVVIGTIYESRVGAEFFAQLYGIHSESVFTDTRGERRWAMGCNPKDPKVSQALDLLASIGYLPRVGLVGRDGPSRDPTHYEPNAKYVTVRTDRSYTPRDREKCELLELLGDRYYDEILPEYAPLSQLWIEPKVARSKSAFVQSQDTRNIIVPQRVRDLLEASGLRNLQFKPVKVGEKTGPGQRRHIPWDRLKSEPWWDLWSDFVMPPLSPTCVKVDHKGDPYVEGQSVAGVILHEGFYVWPEMHYRRSDIAALPPFDIALTHEMFDQGATADYKRAKVVSQRFYRFCVEKGLRAKWRPVRIDEDL